MMYREPEIKIPQYQWDRINRRLAKLQALEDHGVQYWAMHDTALREWQKKVDIEDSVQEMIDDINDILTEADIDQPAGPGCGYAISFDEKEMAKRLEEFYERHNKLRLL
jgi:hypothetical protein